MVKEKIKFYSFLMKWITDTMFYWETVRNIVILSLFLGRGRFRNADKQLSDSKVLDTKIKSYKKVSEVPFSRKYKLKSQPSLGRTRSLGPIKRALSEPNFKALIHKSFR